MFTKYPNNKSDVVIRYLHKAKLVQELKEQVPNSFTFNIGYFEGQRHAKIACSWGRPARKYASDEITLWCEGCLEISESSVPAKKRKYNEKEEEADGIFKELKEKHLENYATTKLRLWARMIGSGIYPWKLGWATQHSCFFPSSEKILPKDSLCSAVKWCCCCICICVRATREQYQY